MWRDYGLSAPSANAAGHTTSSLLAMFLRGETDSVDRPVLFDLEGAEEMEAAAIARPPKNLDEVPCRQRGSSRTPLRYIFPYFCDVFLPTAY